MRSTAWIWASLVIATVAAFATRSPLPALGVALVYPVAFFQIGTRRRNAEVRDISERVRVEVQR